MTPLEPDVLERALRKLELGQPLNEGERAAIAVLDEIDRREKRAAREARPSAPPPPRRVFVSRRTFQMMQPRPKKLPQSAADSAALRAAVLRRQSKAAKRARAHHKVRLLEAPADAPTPDSRSTCD